MSCTEMKVVGRDIHPISYHATQVCLKLLHSCISFKPLPCFKIFSKQRRVEIQLFLYCVQYPIRLTEDVLESLSFLPLPLLDTSKEHFQKFAEVYGLQSSENNRPSLVHNASEDAKEIDKGRKSMLVSGKIRDIITRGECIRCIYSPAKLTPKQLKEIADVKESQM